MLHAACCVQIHDPRGRLCQCARSGHRHSCDGSHLYLKDATNGCHAQYASRAMVSEVVHEALHIAGLHHQHQRHDRDEHISMCVEHDGRWEDCFLLSQLGKKVADKFGTQSPAYDHSSATHYPPSVVHPATCEAMTLWTLTGRQAGDRALEGHDAVLPRKNSDLAMLSLMYSDRHKM